VGAWAQARRISIFSSLPRVQPPSKTHVENVKPFAASGIHINGRQSP